MTNGGFDVIVGNPPYIEDGNYHLTDPSGTDMKIVKLSKNGKTNNISVDLPLFYESRSCGNTHAYFIERSLKLLNSKGKFGFIVPVSLISTQRMSSIRKVIQENSSNVKYYNFDDRPSKIFSGIEHCRSTIVITTKGPGVAKSNNQ
jgi:methylase of polypeptide subunit release factors